jgi:hypothetical protein
MNEINDGNTIKRNVYIQDDRAGSFYDLNKDRTADSLADQTSWALYLLVNKRTFLNKK